MPDYPMWPGMMIGGLFWIVWLVVSVLALLAFFRGMRALTQIAATLERIEQRQGTGRGGDHSGAI